VDAQLVPGHRLGRDDHRVAGLDPHRRVVVVGDPHEGRERLALASGAEDQHLAGRILLQLVRPDQRLLRHLDVAEVPGDVHVLAHRAADHANLATDVDGDVDRLLHPVDVGGERGDEDAAGTGRDQLAEGLADEPLRAGHTGPLRVRRVAQEEVDAAVADLGQPSDVSAQAVHRGVVDLVVPGVEDAPARAVDDDRDRVGDRMRDPDELGAERPQLHGPAVWIRLTQLHRAQQSVLVELRLDQAERQAGGPDLLHACLAEQVRERADVVLVPVREQHRAYRPLAVDQVREVGQDQVDAEVLVAREREACIDHDGLAAGLEHGHVLADLAESAERDDSGASGHRRSLERERD
jgi:hypothetical protein